jgi:tetratricopeptide (TPR) repeat protein
MHGTTFARTLTLLALTWTALLVPLRTGAQSDDQEQRARVHFESGRLHYEAGRFARAAEEFEQAYELSDKADLLYNLFLAHRDAGQLEQAIDALEQYLQDVPDPPNRSKLEARLATMRAQLESGRAEDGAPPADAAPADVTLDGEKLDDETSGLPVGPIATLGAGGALLVGALITGIMAKGAESDLDDACPGRVDCDPADASIRDRMNRLGVATDVLWITGAVAAAGGLIWLLVSGRSDEAPEEPALSFGCGPGACGVAYRGAF